MKIMGIFLGLGVMALAAPAMAQDNFSSANSPGASYAGYGSAPSAGYATVNAGGSFGRNGTMRTESKSELVYRGRKMITEIDRQLKADIPAEERERLLAQKRQLQHEIIVIQQS